MITGKLFLTEANSNTGPFNLYSDVDGFIIPFNSGVSRATLLSGFPTADIPDGTLTIRIRSNNGTCTNYTDVSLECFNYLPQNASYITSFVSRDTYVYSYGYFLQYSEAGVVTTNNRIVKLNENLTIDTSFVVGVGLNEIYYTGSDVIEQSDGKILLSGTFTSYQGVSANRIVRLNTDGSRDTSFVIGAGFNNFTQLLNITVDNKIYVTGIFSSYDGVSSPRIARLMSDGTLDPTFVIGSGFNNTSLSTVVYDDLSVIVNGYFSSYNGTAVPGIVKLLENGDIDSSFDVGEGFSPRYPNNAIYTLKEPNSNSFYCVGYFTSFNSVPENYIIKLTETGEKDTSFDPGTGFDAGVYLLKIIWGDKLFVAGTFDNYNGQAANGMAIINPDGSLYFGSSVYFYTPTFIGNKFFASPYDPDVFNCLELIHIFE